ncbi:MAG: type II secretion system inner membrane protein GspF [Omnitrophica bacterium]|nr:type II secretion system inner membrane protein GspF [Candidatus Omnitrophota bacterium]
MANFKYMAKDQQGKTLTATLEAKDKTTLVDLLRKRGLIIISIEEVQAKAVKVPGKAKVKMDDLVIFSRQLATMVDSGIPLVQALDVLAEQIEKPDFQAVVGGLRDSIETGSSLSEALARHPKIFSELFVNMVRAGESSGMLDDILERLADYLEKTSSLQRKVKSSFVYPSLVISMAIAITSILIFKVVPTFQGIFEGLGAELPLLTRMLIAFSDFARHSAIFIIVGLFLLGVAFSKIIRTEKGKMNFDKMLLHLPIVGILLRKVAVARFARTLSTLVKSGVPILNSLEIVAKTSGNKVIEMAVNQVRTNIREGENIAEPLTRSGVFPPMVTRMIGVGEQTGELEKMLSKIADFYEEQVDVAVNSLTSLIEPIIIVVLGVVVGGIVAAMFLPIFQITQIIQ